MKKRVLVTGGAGFISSNFVRHLLEATDHEVVTLDALTYAGNLENLADVMSHPRLSFVHGDIRDAGLVREIVGGRDALHRLVELFGEPVDGLAPLGLTHAFPTAAVLANADLTAAGLAPPVAAAVRAFAAAAEPS